jgi:hypothetical protein
MNIRGVAIETSEYQVNLELFYSDATNIELITNLNAGSERAANTAQSL